MFSDQLFVKGRRVTSHIPYPLKKRGAKLVNELEFYKED